MRDALFASLQIQILYINIILRWSISQRCSIIARVHIMPCRYRNIPSYKVRSRYAKLKFVSQCVGWIKYLISTGIIARFISFCDIYIACSLGHIFHKVCLNIHSPCPFGHTSRKAGWKYFKWPSILLSLSIWSNILKIFQ